ncbi:hypothetical protein SLEP1_g55955 [Rubroshorea leprosula]|uniref:Uncharacterized protein n=1 Tax=Rubroshorea leprosula TaxID=152421 RepID=A0AAV5MKW1_9ROSI|nr:hypothetical protein SLEP1_g55955 [Rubroshorea leprosula]
MCPGSSECLSSGVDFRLLVFSCGYLYLITLHQRLE